MHKKFYASGFLLHTASGQILLQASPSEIDSKFTWTLFSAKNIGDEEPVQAFQRVLLDVLDLTLPQQNIRSVYDYFDDIHQTHHYVLYGILPEDGFTPETLIDDAFGWFRVKQLSKISIAPQDKQDIIVSERVINAEIRENMPTPISEE